MVATVIGGAAAVLATAGIGITAVQVPTFAMFMVEEALQTTMFSMFPLVNEKKYGLLTKSLDKYDEIADFLEAVIETSENFYTEINMDSLSSYLIEPYRAYLISARELSASYRSLVSGNVADENPEYMDLLNAIFANTYKRGFELNLNIAIRKKDLKNDLKKERIFSKQYNQELIDLNVERKLGRRIIWAEHNKDIMELDAQWFKTAPKGPIERKSVSPISLKFPIKKGTEVTLFDGAKAVVGEQILNLFQLVKIVKRDTGLETIIPALLIRGIGEISELEPSDEDELITPIPEDTGLISLPVRKGSFLINIEGHESFQKEVAPGNAASGWQSSGDISFSILEWTGPEGKIEFKQLGTRANNWSEGGLFEFDFPGNTSLSRAMLRIKKETGTASALEEGSIFLNGLEIYRGVMNAGGSGEEVEIDITNELNTIINKKSSAIPFKELDVGERREEPTAKAGINLQTDPGNAMIFVDDSFVGNTPLEFEVAANLPLFLAVSLAGFHTSFFELILEPGEIFDLGFSMLPIQ